MATKSYSERRQAILFVAAREYFRLAAAILDDCQTEAEFTGQSAAWRKKQAATTAKRGWDLENEGYEQCIASAHASNASYRAHREYERAIDRFEARAAVWGVTPDEIQAKLEATL